MPPSTKTPPSITAGGNTAAPLSRAITRLVPRRIAREYNSSAVRPDAILL